MVSHLEELQDVLVVMHVMHIAMCKSQNVKHVEVLRAATRCVWAGIWSQCMGEGMQRDSAHQDDIPPVFCVW